MDTNVDAKKLSKTANFVHAVMIRRNKSTLTTALTIGHRLYKDFFGGNPTAIRSRTKEYPSLAALISHPRTASFDIKHRTLVYYVNVAIQEERFDKLIAKGKMSEKVKTLGYSQRLALLPSKTTTILIEAASCAVDEKLTRDQVKELVSSLNAQNANAPKASKPRSPVDRPLRALIFCVRDLYALDLSSLDTDDLEALRTLAYKHGKQLVFLSHYIDAELASKGPAPLQTVMDNWAADDPQALDDLLAGFTLDGEALGLGDTLRDDALQVVNHLGNELLANAVYAKPDALREWWEPFLGEVSVLLPDSLEKEAGPSNKGVLSATKPKKTTWYAVSTYLPTPPSDPTAELEPDDIRRWHFDDQERFRCIVKAANADEAREHFRKVGLPLVPAEGFHVHSELLSGWLKRRGKRTAISKYIREQRPNRLPTLEEFLVENSRTDRNKSDCS